MAVRFGSTNAGSLIARKLLDIRVITCAAPSYLERFGVPTRPEDIDGHEAILFRDPETGRAFPWEFHRGGEIIRAKVEGRIVFDDPSAAVAACIAGQGIFQSLEIGLDSWLQTGQLRQILKNWSDEHYPLYAYHPARHLPPAKVRAFLDFVQRVAREKARHDGRRKTMRPHCARGGYPPAWYTSVKSGNDDQALPLSVREPVSIRVMPSSVGVMFGSRPSASAVITPRPPKGA